jgi:O-antigen ligase
MRTRSATRGAARVGWWALCAVVLVPPFLVSPAAEDAFRLVKLAAAETLALVSLLALAAGWWHRGSVSLAALARRPGVRLAALLLAAAAPGVLFLATHPPLARRAGASLAIALGCLLAWSLRFDRHALRRALELAAAPAVALAALAILQAHGVFSPFAFAQGEGRQRYGLTSLAGSVGDLAAYLVLPALVLQAGLASAATRRARLVRAGALATIAYALFLTQTLAALAAVGVASLLFWLLVLAPRRRWLAALPLLAILGAVVLLPGLGRRVERKVEQLRAVEINAFLSGRLDGWSASLAMFAERPWFGVGHGGFRAHFATTKLDLVERGESFYSRGRSAHFANAHSDYLEALAEWGLWGAAIVALALAVVLGRLRALWRGAPRVERALAVAGSAGVATLAVASFPFHLALTGYSWVLFLAWLCADDGSSDSPRAVEPVRAKGKQRSREAERPPPGRATAPAWAVAAVATALLAPALVVHVRTLAGRLEASRILRTTTQVAQLAMQSGATAARPVLQANLRPLHRAEELDPVEAGIPMAIGSHYLLLENAPSARDAYQRARAREPRPNLYLNFARLLLLEGRRDEAMAAAGDAVALDPALRDDAEALGWAEDGRRLRRSAR